MIEIESSRASFYSATILSLLCIFLFYRHIDQSVTLDHQTQQNINSTKNIELLKKMLEVKMIGMKKEEVTQFIQSDLTKDHLVKYEADSISIDNIVLKFKDQKLISIEYIN